MSVEVGGHINHISRMMEQNNLSQVEYDTDSMERVRNEIDDFLKSLETKEAMEKEN